MTETFAQRVERLKKNEKHVIFIDMTEEDKAYLRKIGAENCQYLATVLNGNLAWCNGHKGDDFAFTCCVYRIRPDYQPQPEYVEYEIIIGSPDNMLGAYMADAGPYPFVHLHCLPSLPGFAGFRLKENDKVAETSWEITLVASLVAEGKAVVARFPKK